MRELSSVTDYYLICTGNSSPHVKALAEEVQRSLRDVGERCFKKTGTPDSGWMIVDYVHVVVHVFSAEARGYYDLERLWKDAPIIPTDLDPAAS